MPDALIKEVAAPGSVFWETVTHPENLELLEGDPEKTRKLPKDRLKKAIRKFEQLQDSLNGFYSAYLDMLALERADFQFIVYAALYLGSSSHKWFSRLNWHYAIKAARAVDRIDHRIEMIRANMHPVKHWRRNPYSVVTLEDAKKAQSLIHRLAARIEEHYKALENEAISKRLRDEMMQEISYYARQIVDRWTALGYRQEITEKGRTRFKRVQIEEAHYTEDSIQFKIFVTSLSVLHSTHHHLPDRVKAWDLVKPETTRELEVACECPVTSPHNPDEEDQRFEHGAWVEVHRVGMRGGLFEYIELDTVLAKYNQALRPRFAIPIGIKAGRQIEYIYLDSTPHVIITGITGSGKTNLERVILTSLIKFYEPSELQFVIVDLKRGGDVNDFQNIPHLITPIIKDIRVLEQVASKLYGELLRRSALLSSVDAFDILEYNRKVTPESRMPRIMFIVDECGTIRDAAESKEQRDSIWRYLGQIAMLARSVGIHLVLCSQQPGVTVIPSPVTNNISVSIDGRQRTSSGAMQTSGNNKLKELPAIPGRMALDNGMAFFQIQTPYATKQLIGETVQIASNYPPAPPLLLLADDHEGDTQPLNIAITGVTRERVIELALELHSGVMNVHKLYEATGGLTPRAKIQELINGIAAENELTHNGVLYKIKKQGRGFRIVANTEIPNTEVSNSGIYDGNHAVLNTEGE